MIKIYIDPNGNQVPKPSCLNYNGTCYVPPTDEQLEAAGWEIREEEDKPVLPTYSELVEEYIHDHGFPTYGAELAILNNYAENPAQYAQAYTSYLAIRREAKEWANTQPHREEVDE